MAPGPKKRQEPLWPFLLILLLTLGAWGGYWCWLTQHIPNGEDFSVAQAQRGQFGDMFGGLNAIFSAMAFAVLIYTMWLQRTELRLQREELHETRAELARQATAQEKSEQALTHQLKAMTAHAEAATAQVQAMRALAEATKEQVRHERDLAEASRKQADALNNLANTIRQIKWGIR
jgi:hypothetical protein